MMTRPSVVVHAAEKYAKTLADPAEFVAANRRIIHNRPNSDLYAKYPEIGIVDITNPRSGQDFILLSEYSGRIPGLGRLHLGNTVALNTLRADLFDALIQARGGRDVISDAGLKSLSRYVGTGTGRGRLGPFEAVARQLSFGFLSPKWFISRFQHLTDAPGNLFRALAARDYGTTRLLAQEYAKHYFFTSAVGHVAALAASYFIGGDSHYTANPLNPNYGLLTVNGRNYDMTGGMRKPVRLTSASGQSLLGYTKPMDTVQTIGGLFTGALGPGGRLMTEALQRKEMGTGRKIDFSDPSDIAWFAAHGFVPLPVQSFTSALIENGMSAETARQTAAALMGISNWQKKPKK
jgi:hypothetical protein